MAIRIISLNLKHSARAKDIHPELSPTLHTLKPDILVLCEYVDGKGRPEFHEELRHGGLEHIAVSDPVNYDRKRWQNQILIASRSRIEILSLTEPGPDSVCISNYLSVQTFGIDLTGLRVPAYTTPKDWYEYWEWLTSVLGGDVAIGDFNTDPRRPRKWDRVFTTMADALGFEIVTPKDSWSFRNASGHESQIDHALVRNRSSATSARYETTLFVPQFTDHAALVVELEQRPALPS